jgi:hypothetical protein
MVGRSSMPHYNNTMGGGGAEMTLSIGWSRWRDSRATSPCYVEPYIRRALKVHRSLVGGSASSQPGTSGQQWGGSCTRFCRTLSFGCSITYSNSNHHQHFLNNYCCCVLEVPTTWVDSIQSTVLAHRRGEILLT